MDTSSTSQQHPTLILGTAMWAWNIAPKQCFQLLDEFYAAGFRQVDAATNYPINKNPGDFRASEKILLEWITANGCKDLEVIMKVGSINNLFTPEHNLRKSFLLICLDDYLHRFGLNLNTFMIHWDTRRDENEIYGSLEALQIASQQGMKVGLSGIKYPEVYAKLNSSFQLDFRIEIKHNLFYSDYDRYEVFHDKDRFLAYGINAGGVKLGSENYGEKSTLRTRGVKLPSTSFQEKLQLKIPSWNASEIPVPIKNFNQIGMLNAFHHPGINGILIGPSNTIQLGHSIDFHHQLGQGAYRNIYQELQQISSQIG